MCGLIDLQPSKLMPPRNHGLWKLATCRAVACDATVVKRTSSRLVGTASRCEIDRREPVMLRIVQCIGLVMIDESAQKGGSFKWRGVQAQLARLQAQHITVTFSSGNHGVSVALAAQQRGSHAIVVVPEWVEPDKHRLLHGLGCTVVRKGSSALECERAAQEIRDACDGVLLHPFRSRRQIAGYTTLWAELAETFPDGADVIVPVGAGGLLASGVLYRAQARARYHLIGAEPARCSSLSQGLSAGRPYPLATRSMFAAGLNVNEAPEEVLELIMQTDDLDLYKVEDHEMATAAVMLSAHGMGIDSAASAGVACALFREIRRHHRVLLVILTGRGAKVTSVRLREQGLLNLTDREIGTIAPRTHRIASHLVMTPTPSVAPGVTDERYFPPRLSAGG